MSSEKTTALSRRRFITRSATTGLGFIVGPGLLAACGGEQTGGGSADAGTGKLLGPIAYQAPLSAWVIGDIIERAVRELASQLKLDIKVVNFNGDSDRELAQIDQLGTLGVKAVSTVILDGGLTRQLAAACKRNDIYLSSWATMGPWVLPSEPAIDFHYQGLANPSDGAYVTCVNMFKELNGKGTFVHLSGAGGVATSPAKDKAVDRALKEFPGIEMVAREYGEYNREKSRQVLSNILSKTAGKADAIYCQSDDEAVGALDALRERNQLGKTLVAGADGIPEFVDAIIDGRGFGTEGNVPLFGAGWTMMQALDASAGFKPRPAETLMMQDLIMVDNPESAKAYKEMVLTKGAERGQFDYTRMSRVLHPDDWDPQWPMRTYDPTQYWGVTQGVKKPNGYSLPDNYTKDAAERSKVDADYKSRLKKFPLADVAKSSRTGKTLFEQVDAAAGS